MILQRLILKQAQADTCVSRYLAVLLANVCFVNSWAFTTTSENGASAQTETSIGINSPAFAEIKAVSYGDDSAFSQDFAINEEELIWLRRFMATSTYDDTTATTYLLPIKIFHVCLVSTNQEGLFLKVNNGDLTSVEDPEGTKIQTVVQVVGNGGATQTSARAKLLFLSSDRRNNANSTQFQMVDIASLNTSDGSINTIQPLADSLTVNSPLTGAPITDIDHDILSASDTMHAFDHFSIIEGEVTASTSRQLQFSTGVNKQFGLYQSAFSENSCGNNNAAVVKIAMFINLEDLFGAPPGKYTASLSTAMCTDATCGET